MTNRHLRSIAMAVGMIVAGQAVADGPISAAEFEALAEGNTLHFSLGDAPFGAETFHAGRRSVWRFPDGTCESGTWRERDGAICFAYDGDPGEQCWRFSRSGGRVLAHFVENGVPDPEPVTLDRIDRTVLTCPGPHVGA